MSLETELQAVLLRGLERVREGAEDPLGEALENAATFVKQGVPVSARAEALEGLKLLEGLGPVLEGATREELRALLSEAWKGAHPGEVLDLRELAYEARRVAFRAETREAMADARKRAERLTFLGDLVDALGYLAVRLLPVVIAGL